MDVELISWDYHNVRFYWSTILARENLLTLHWNVHAVHTLQVEIGELKGRLTEVISDCDALCKRIAAEGPESLRSSIKPFAITAADQDICISSSSLQTNSRTKNPPLAKE